VVEKKTMVLVAGFDKGAFEALGPVLARDEFEVVRMASTESSVDLALAKSFDVMLFNADRSVGTLATMVESIRDEKSASREISLLVIADPGEADAARDLIGRGVDRVMLVDDSPELIGQQVAALLDVAPRGARRFSVRLKTSVSDGTVDVVGEVVNLSVSGMLVETITPFEPDAEVVVSIDLGGQWGSVSSKAVVVRRAYRARGGIDGIGIRFVGLVGDDKAKIEGFLDEAFADQLSV
jgi:DNA-binding NarL/FixJ family response regulator